MSSMNAVYIMMDRKKSSSHEDHTLHSRKRWVQAEITKENSDFFNKPFFVP
jgi:hypothetical protein